MYAEIARVRAKVPVGADFPVILHFYELDPLFAW
jgi:hypothetical protein